MKKIIFIFLVFVFAINNNYAINKKKKKRKTYGTVGLLLKAGFSMIQHGYVNPEYRYDEFTPFDISNTDKFRTYNFYGGMLSAVFSVRLGKDASGWNKSNRGFSYYSSHNGYFTDLELGIDYFISGTSFSVNDKNGERTFDTETEEGFDGSNSEGSIVNGELYFEGISIEKEDTTSTTSDSTYSTTQKVKMKPAQSLTVFFNYYLWHFNFFIFDISPGIGVRINYYVDFSDMVRYKDDNFLRLNDRTVAVPGIALRFYFTILAARLFVKFFIPVPGMIMYRLKDKKYSMDVEETVVDLGFDYMFYKGLYFRLGAQAKFYRYNPVIDDNINQTRSDGDYNIRRLRNQYYFYLGLGLLVDLA